MNRPLVRILLWGGVAAVLTVAAMGIWMVFFGGDQSTGSLKWLQCIQTIGTFALPPIICAWLWSEDHRPFRWLKMDQGLSWQTGVTAVLIMICAVPAINLLADLNSRIVLPESLGFIEDFLRQQEEAAAALTARFLQADSVVELIINIGLMALLPALAEEMTFRGTLQQLPENKIGVHTAIWVTAFVFSAIHMQFYGFIPRMLMGAMFGYMFVWTGSLWVPILMHFSNNAIAVTSYYLCGAEGTESNWADTIGAGPSWWLGLISLTAVGLLLYFTNRDPRGYVRRTRRQ